MASISASCSTIPVTPAYAPSITIEPPSGLPRSVATVVAGRRIRVTGAFTSAVKVVSFTSTSPPGRSLGSSGVQNSSCIAIADHALGTTGGASIGPSATTMVLSVLPPRIMPP